MKNETGLKKKDVSLLIVLTLSAKLSTVASGCMMSLFSLQMHASYVIVLHPQTDEVSAVFSFSNITFSSLHQRKKKEVCADLALIRRRLSRMLIIASELEVSVPLLKVTESYKTYEYYYTCIILL